MIWGSSLPFVVGPSGPFLMENSMSEDQKLSLRLFLEEHWSEWEYHCETQGEDPNDIYINQLGGEE